MLAEDLMKMIYAEYKGVWASNLPNPSDDKYLVALNHINNAVQSWAENPEYRWQSLRSLMDVTLIDGVAMLPADFDRFVSKVWVNGVETDVIRHDEVFRFTDGVYVFGASPAKISTVDREIKTANIVGPYISKPPKVVSPESIVVCDNHRWVALYVAAKIAASDPAKEEIAPDLFAQADVEFKLMAKRATYRPKGSRVTPTTRSTRLMGRSW